MVDSERGLARSLGLIYFKAGIKYAAKVLLKKGLEDGLKELEKLCRVLEAEVDEKIAEEVLGGTPYTEKIVLRPQEKF